MSFSLVPQYSFRGLMDITPAFLGSLGISFLMLDLDNTVAAYDEHAPSAEIAQWVSETKAQGIQLHIVSNSVRKGRVGAFSDALGIGAVLDARKPSVKRVRAAMSLAGYPPDRTGLVGDQIFTDTLAANRIGAVSIIVRPRRFSNPFLALRYALEIPFRAMAGRRAANLKTGG
jgi:hypothetical protein